MKARDMVKSVGRFGVVLVVAGLVVVVALAGSAGASGCSNEAFRTGRSASLPDCRAYELVTPEDLSSTGDMTFTDNNDKTLASTDGEHLALEAKKVFIEPGVSQPGTNVVFSRTPAGWRMKSAVTPAMAGEVPVMQFLSPEFSQAALRAAKPVPAETTVLNLVYGPVGGPYSTLTIPPPFVDETSFLGANAGEPGRVAPFSNVFFGSPDHAVLPPGPERAVAEETETGRSNLYESRQGELRLVNASSDGKMLNPCGATLGAGATRQGGGTINAVSADGSRVFFTSPQGQRLPGCGEPQLYMRVDGSETVEVSEPEQVTIPPSQRGPVQFDGASPDGSRVYFTTTTALTPEAGARGPYLYEYDSRAQSEHRLTPIADEAGSNTNINPGFVVSADGWVVYYSAAGGIRRYDARTGTGSFVAVPSRPSHVEEPWYATSDGEFFVFAAGQPGEPAVEVEGPHGRERELRGAGHDELYRYDAADGTVMCVSCGEGAAPAQGETFEPEGTEDLIESQDASRGAVSISDDGRRVFFQTSAQLVPQDTNSGPAISGNPLGNGADVYEWEADGTEEAPGVFCGVANGCTHLISAGEAVGPEKFLGASTSGRDVFFSSAAQLLPQATPEFTNIYDARVNGGFPVAPPRVECASCQGVGAPPPQFGQAASETFSGAGNAAPASNSPPVPTKPKPRRTRTCRHGLKRHGRGRCVRVARNVRGQR